MRLKNNKQLELTASAKSGDMLNRTIVLKIANARLPPQGSHAHPLLLYFATTTSTTAHLPLTQCAQGDRKKTYFYHETRRAATTKAAGCLLTWQTYLPPRHDHHADFTSTCPQQATWLFVHCAAHIYCTQFSVPYHVNLIIAATDLGPIHSSYQDLRSPYR